MSTSSLSQLLGICGHLGLLEFSIRGKGSENQISFLKFYVFDYVVYVLHVFDGF